MISSANCIPFGSFDEALTFCFAHQTKEKSLERKYIEEGTLIEDVYVCGGSNVYKEALEKHTSQCKAIYLTVFDKVFEADTFFPEIDHEQFTEIDKSDVFTENGVAMEFHTYSNKSIINEELENKENHEEYQYLNAVKHIIEHGIEKRKSFFLFHSISFFKNCSLFYPSFFKKKN